MNKNNNLESNTGNDDTKTRNNGLLLPNHVYDCLKWLAIYFIPALTTFIGVVGIALTWEHTAVATTICGAAGGFLASCIGMSTHAYEQALNAEYQGNEEDE